ncbi:UPF0235 protein C15orf40 homolog isoform X2 [Mugil cephalus]|uniref:UPF0235 protein C15orf40 homolog isoform X2 n=1 Tax=Mugil cephalus TaxID=48193 RepID=UPI001FB78D6B|nr:UPF0235 protein C15orf40 homolog isoform X2 [Mugil cephalus]
MFSWSVVSFRSLLTFHWTRVTALNVSVLSRRFPSLFRVGAALLSGPSSRTWTSSGTRTREMPKKDKVMRGQPAGGTVAESRVSGPVSLDRSGAVVVVVHAKPGSKHSAITEVSAEAVGVAIAAPPTDGEANTELIRYLAEVLDLKKSHVSLDKGSRSRDKLIRVDSSLSVEEVLRKLQEAAG